MKCPFKLPLGVDVDDSMADELDGFTSYGIKDATGGLLFDTGLNKDQAYYLCEAVNNYESLKAEKKILKEGE